MKVDRYKARETVRKMVCADCHGQLIEYFGMDKDNSEVKCTTIGCPCSGFIPRRLVDGTAEETRRWKELRLGKW